MKDAVETAAVRMVVAGLPLPWVLRVAALARTNGGVLDLLELWCASEDEPERGAAVAAIEECLEDEEGRGPFVRVGTPDEVDGEAARRRAYKAHLRALVEARGGVSLVARAAGIPQPSLSRLLASGSWPRPRTVQCLAAALEVNPSTLSPEAWVSPRRHITARVADHRQYKPTELRVGRTRLGSGGAAASATDPARLRGGGR